MGQTSVHSDVDRIEEAPDLTRLIIDEATARSIMERVEFAPNLAPADLFSII